MLVYGLLCALVTYLYPHQVNRMCSNLTNQVRSIAAVTTAVAKGDLTQRVEVEVEGEMATLKASFHNLV
jgi:osomolarity two-component system sensor histidine kinase NIK1